MSRERILERVRSRCRALAARKPIAPERATPARGPLPRRPDDLVDAFRAKARALASTVIGPVDAGKAPETVAMWLTETNLGKRAVIWPELAGMNWRTAGIDVEAREALGTDLVGITGAFCAVAETGTLVLLSGATTPATVSLLPETHVALVPLKRVVAYMEDAFDLLRRERGGPPRAINLVSGPSRTADVEQTVTLGAHGPYRVAVILVRGDP
ncbi:membrane protein [Sulfurifustis variabilis]|uniref:Membrane protein n=1 Tax=Sulfurifustis variabilis TaxID=1675686 RepID=A0A1C7AF90_9GAMM|nr:lactate utilization protein C [Sulfurifustis variabilis]BAU49935.1 membrane protein [Sulfurifustis variabilis]